MKDQISLSKIFKFKTLLNQHFMLKDRIKRTTDLVELALQADLKAGVDYKQFHELYDISEAALNEFVQYLDLPKNIIEASNYLQRITAVLPTFTERSSEQSLYQQFSTPIEVAWIMVQLAGISAGDVLLEPSAGTGSISSLIKKTLASSIYVNEKHELRYLLLSEQGYHQAFKEDATQIHNMPKFRELGINKIILNPPFSRSILTKEKIDTKAGAKHLVSSFKLLPKNGRIVLLINESFTTNSRGFKHFSEQVSDFHLVLNASLSKNTFHQKGTSFDTRIMVIDKAPLHANTVKEQHLTTDNVQSILNHININHG